ncbi:MAG: hypothetical protein JOZ73_09745, partial [Solirubrobacterales bacterium]|nr:hypothetical protein [Solirubrobacterales bacterium]
MESQPGDNRVVWTVIVGLIVILIIGSVVGSSSSTTSAVAPGMQAVILPTQDASRRVIVAPCGTGTQPASSNPTTARNTPGAITIALPAGEGTRVVLIPKCTGSQGGVTTSSHFPSAAFVTKPGTATPPVGSARSTSSSSLQAGSPYSAQLQAIVPNGSPI